LIRRHPVRAIMLGTCMVLGLDLAAWLVVLAWHLAVVLVPAAIALGPTGPGAGCNAHGNTLKNRKSSRPVVRTIH